MYTMYGECRGIAKMKIKWNELPDNFRLEMIAAILKLYSSFNPIDVAVLWWSLGAFDAPFDTLLSSELVISLFKAIMRTLPDMKASEISKTLWGLSCTGLSWDELPSGLKWSVPILCFLLRQVFSYDNMLNLTIFLLLILYCV